MKPPQLDTNILTAFRDRDHPMHANVDAYLAELSKTAKPIIAPQSLYEFWAVATRPTSVNGFGWSPQETYEDVRFLQRAFTILPEPSGLLNEWLELCRTHGVSGKNAHDARLAAYARLNGIGTLVTLNARDFARYGLTVVVP